MLFYIYLVSIYRWLLEAVFSLYWLPLLWILWISWLVHYPIQNTTLLRLSQQRKVLSLSIILLFIVNSWSMLVGCLSGYYILLSNKYVLYPVILVSTILVYFNYINFLILFTVINLFVLLILRIQKR